MTNTDFEKELVRLKLSKKDFTQIVGMPYQTLMNWKGKDETPAWVEPFLRFYEKSVAFDELLRVIEKFRG